MGGWTARGAEARASRHGGAVRVALLGGLLALGPVPLVLGCAGDLVVTATGFRHLRQGYQIANPNGPGRVGGPWRKVDVEGAALAFRREGPQSMSLQSRCGRPRAHPAIMARQLLIRVTPRELVQASPLLIAGHEGWLQVIDTRRDGRAVRVKTVTMVAGDCTFDWVLAAAGDAETAERDFDDWWQSFELELEPGGGA